MNKKITGRGQLIDLINKMGVETFTTDIEEDRKTLNTIIHCKRNNEFYRIVWGEVKGKNDVYYLWYEEEMKNVKLNRETGEWQTKEERNKSINAMNENMIGANIKEMELYNMKDGLIFINGLNTEIDEKEGVNSVEIVAGRAASGKSQHVYIETLKAIKKDESVLFFTTDCDAKEVLRRLVRASVPEIYRKHERNIELTEEELKELDEAFDFLSNSKLIIDDNYLIDDNYILDKMEEAANSENGLDLVIIDSLKLTSGIKNNEAIVGIHKKTDIYRQKLGCKVIITTQLARSYAQ